MELKFTLPDYAPRYAGALKGDAAHVVVNRCISALVKIAILPDHFLNPLAQSLRVGLGRAHFGKLLRRSCIQIVERRSDRASHSASSETSGSLPTRRRAGSQMIRGSPA